MFKVRFLAWSEDAELHIRSRHGVTVSETEEAAYNHRLALKGRTSGVYEVFGRSDAGLYLLVVVRYLGRGSAKVITARDMTETERRRYRRHASH